MTNEPGFGEEEEVERYMKESEAALPLQPIQAVNVDIANPR